MKSSKAFTLLVLSLTSLALVALIVFRTASPDAALRSGPGVPAVDANPDYKRLSEEWRAKAYVPLPRAESDLTVAVDALGVGCGRASNGLPHRRALNIAVASVLRSWNSDTYADYLQARSVGLGMEFQPDQIRLQGALLRRFHRVEPVSDDPMTVHEAFWTANSQGDAKSRWFGEVCWEESFLCMEPVRREPREFSDEFFGGYLQEHVPNCGLTVYRSTWKYQPDPERVVQNNGECLVAFAYILTRTQEQLAYPIITRYYYAPSCDQWLPLQLAVGYVGTRARDPVF